MRFSGHLGEPGGVGRGAGDLRRAVLARHPGQRRRQRARHHRGPQGAADEKGTSTYQPGEAKM